MAETKQRLKVYLETSFISYLVARPSSDSERAMRQAYTLRWWETIASQCELFVSDFVYDEAQDGDDEAQDGDADAAARRIAEIVKIPFLAFDRSEVDALTRELRNRHQVFEKEVTDAAHIAVCAVTGIDILLTWNCHHMANIVELPKTVRIVTQCGYECPMIITPKDYLEKINV